MRSVFRVRRASWPANQMACKVAPALAAGCTMVLKPSELAPLSALILAEILDDAGVPAGVFNLVNGDGEGVGAPLAAHHDVDMVSFTGSTRAGKLVMKTAADTVKKVALELGGKSANILLDDADFPRMVKLGVLTDLRGIQGGIENTNYFVTCERDGATEEHVLTVFERLSFEQLTHYISH